MNCRFLLSTLLVSSSLFSFAQYGAKTFAITGNTNGDFNWKNIRQVDIATGKVIKDVFSTAAIGGVPDYVAASAYDAGSNKIFYSTLHSGQLGWFDLDKGNSSVTLNRFLTVANPTDESLNITRMCINADGNGYALTNDGSHLYQFNTSGIVLVKDLGTLIDADANKSLSVHNKCTSWGGDMIADAFGKLYIITATHNVFKVDVETRVATFIGAITGLPGTYSTNGAAVDDNGDIVVNSSLSKEGSYKVVLSTLAATKIQNSESGVSVSDLANSNLLLQKEADAARGLGKISSSVASVKTGNGHVYPNPVTNKKITVSFDGVKAGTYVIKITDLTGKPILSRSVVVNTAGQTGDIALPLQIASGMYLIKAEGADKQSVFTDKILVK
ncbi:T9SS type A sorting domain-containing protein [Ferruginibacter albus]|uniref:T9SS type A sorting domain-containing protein n=1 Tax=Ferruginibacter albus TaxID=2875540 RepID=UPI001CC70854|nr:T9SS type A sorting domain-containing protein [Ferruginibacter albus]UAY53488.1 T9SS type A sorting domain-containing protein [Ferruginibacter albus]